MWCKFLLQNLEYNVAKGGVALSNGTNVFRIQHCSFIDILMIYKNTPTTKTYQFNSWWFDINI